MQLRQESHSSKMKSGAPVTMYVGRAKAHLYRNLVATGFEMKPDELAWIVLAGLPKRFSTLKTIREALESAFSSVDAILPKLLVHEHGFEELPKEKGGSGSDFAMAYVVGRNKPDRRKHKPKQKEGGKPPKGVAISVIDGVSTDEWLVDSDSSQHQTGDKICLRTSECSGGVAENSRSGTKGPYGQRGAAR
ncbi:hypothetical protein KFL_016820015 [Klebsormidium nitens]|uniref:Uncharacterized protein n=1 Tax=Klebsormidium nitens TaxID=105231 RepID=A0A1Y1IVD6_KLENI|nr:hypothetical protein KFL_016820015 [Klebsormidium nitens]|eukprot:GAQ93589.1 hypothetical protein KFL_016820015 [Klebsormidium nitens]